MNVLQCSQAIAKLKFRHDKRVGLIYFGNHSLHVTRDVQLGRSQNTVPIASTQVAIKGTVQYSTRADVSQESVSEQLATRHSQEHTLSAVGPDALVE